VKYALIMIFVFLVQHVPYNTGCHAEGRLEKRIERSIVILDELVQMPEEKIPESLILKCRAIGVFPATLKGGLILGGRYGQGVVLSRDSTSGVWGPPAFFSIGEVSWGLQIGGAAIDLVLVIFGDDVLLNFLNGNIEIGTDATIAAGPFGRDAEVNMDILLKGGIFAYSRSKGLFAGIIIKGAVLSPNNEANRSFYGREVTVRELLIEPGNLAVPDSARQLINTVTGYTEGKK